MAIESAAYVSDLNTANPPGSDPVGQADDHIRLLKSVLKATFPNLTGPVLSTQAQLNYGPVPTGGIIMWSGSTSSVPTGWALCDGSTYAKTDGSGNIVSPDLRSKFVMGSGASTGSPSASPVIGATGGQTSVTPTVTVTNEAVALTEAQLPAHTHANSLTDPGHNHTQNPHTHTYTASTYNNGAYSSGGRADLSSTATTSSTTATNNANTTGITITNASVGSGATHVHNNTAVSSAVSTVPPYYVLAFIMKL